MKKILTMPTLILLLLFTSVAFACSQNETGITTGAACSIKDLNLEKSRTVERRPGFLPYGKKDAGSMRSIQSAPLYDNSECLFGMCLYRTILRNDSK